MFVGWHTKNHECDSIDNHTFVWRGRFGMVKVPLVTWYRVPDYSLVCQTHNCFCCCCDNQNISGYGRPGQTGLLAHEELQLNSSHSLEVFFLQYINGGSLHDILCSDLSEIIPWTERVQIAHNVALGMKYLHSKGIFHRDLTSRVCSMNDEDFFIAIVTDINVFSSLPYTSPEYLLAYVFIYRKII